MTGNQLKSEIKKAGIRQEDAAELLGVTLRTLQYWFKYEILDPNIMQNVKCTLGHLINIKDNEEKVDISHNSVDQPLNSDEMELVRDLVNLMKSQSTQIDRLLNQHDELIAEVRMNGKRQDRALDVIDRRDNITKKKEGAA